MSGHSKNETKEKFQSKRVDYAHMLNWNWWKYSITKVDEGRDKRWRYWCFSCITFSHRNIRIAVNCVGRKTMYIFLHWQLSHPGAHRPENISLNYRKKPTSFYRSKYKDNILLYFETACPGPQPSTWNVKVSTSNGKVLFSNQ